MSYRAIVHISCRPAAQRSYGYWQRTKAFFRGLFRQGPLVEVAFEAFSGRYALPRELQSRYEQRIRKSKGKRGVSERILEMMKGGCDEHAQDFFAGMWAGDFKQALISLGRSSRRRPSTSLIMALRSKGSEHANELTTLRSMATKSIISGGVTSLAAQQVLTPLFAHHSHLDSIFIHHAKILHSSLFRLLNSEHTSPELRAALIDSIHASGCADCRRELGNVALLNPPKPPSFGGEQMSSRSDVMADIPSFENNKRYDGSQ